VGSEDFCTATLHPWGVELVWGHLLVAGFVLLPAVIGIWIALVPIRKAYRMRRAEDELASGAARPTLQPRLGMEAIHLMPTEQRLTSAARDLREAHATLVAAEALLKDAVSLSRWDIAGLSFDRGRAKQSSLGAAARQMRTAQRLTEDAVQTLHVSGPNERIEFDESSLLLDLDTAWLGDGLITGVAIHRQIEKARQQASRMLLRIEELLRKIPSSGGQ
jgi:hypothetical protein